MLAILKLDCSEPVGPSIRILCWAMKGIEPHIWIFNWNMDKKFSKNENNQDGIVYDNYRGHFAKVGQN